MADKLVFALLLRLNEALDEVGRLDLRRTHELYFLTLVDALEAPCGLHLLERTVLVTAVLHEGTRIQI